MTSFFHVAAIITGSEGIKVLCLTCNGTVQMHWRIKCTSVFFSHPNYNLNPSNKTPVDTCKADVETFYFKFK